MTISVKIQEPINSQKNSNHSRWNETFQRYSSKPEIFRQNSDSKAEKMNHKSSLQDRLLILVITFACCKTFAFRSFSVFVPRLETSLPDYVYVIDDTFNSKKLRKLAGLIKLNLIFSAHFSPH